ncbi:cupin-like domain-containing protein [Congregibacter variabilis]|uniref:Cupin-like domain-containing protein n=1 Tax=Congregibacter variabilis TaxID=3081200 RepID=A0ABZ0HXX2_9GAMM|nr:cupin-like domain-containing protein [Congregibacter sp. IMCC43200]
MYTAIVPDRASNLPPKPREWEDVSSDVFRSQIVPRYEPAVLRGLVGDWPAVQKNAESVPSVLDYMLMLDSGQAVYTVAGEPAIKGRFFYDQQLQGVNFGSIASPLRSTVEHLLRLREAPEPPAIAVQAANVNQALPGFTQENPLPLLDDQTQPTFWLGNRAIVAPHFDVKDNIACVVSGRRRFTLFPPEQIHNLYLGPILSAPGGVPISMVDIRNPDLERFPRYAQALESALQVELEPGDAIYIPAPWWHAVESLDSINLLVNYWFAGVASSGISPKASLLHSIMGLRGLPEAQRSAWGHFFNYYLFAETDVTEHWPPGILDVVTQMSPQQKASLIRFLSDSLQE